MTDLTESQTQSIKKNYLNILGLFLSEERIESRYLRCLLKWGLQLRLNPEDLKEAKIDFSDLKFLHPGQKAERVESIYHLVYMIYFDSVVEDIELEVAFVYAEKLGFQKSLVSELFKSIATEQADEINPGNVREQVMEFLKVYEE
ncbi:MAG: hypothetical protein ABIR06_02270 [Cyclobacteriaceae bacterium]